MGRDVARILRGLATDDGRSVVIVSHDTRLREIADRILRNRREEIEESRVAAPGHA
jgi:ABC-type lipoprotein export system ATPase subunit